MDPTSGIRTHAKWNENGSDQWDLNPGRAGLQNASPFVRLFGLFNILFVTLNNSIDFVTLHPKLAIKYMLKMVVRERERVLSFYAISI